MSRRFNDVPLGQVHLRFPSFKSCVFYSTTLIDIMILLLLIDAYKLNEVSQYYS